LLLQALGFQGSTTSASPAQDETTDDTSNETNESREHPIINAEASSNMVTARPTGGHIKCLVCREPTQLSSSSADPFDEMETNEMLALAADRYAAMLSVCGMYYLLSAFNYLMLII
jgi:hypothetical protein